MGQKVSRIVIIPIIALLLVITLAIMALSVLPARAESTIQATEFVVAQNFVFIPDEVTINVGDTIQWDNVQGLHNVVADDGSFTSGAPATDPWTYSRVFDTAGAFPYYCSVHGAPGGIGMSGVLVGVGG